MFSDPDPHGSFFLSAGCKRAKISQKIEKSREISYFEVLDVLFLLKASPVA
jgi:hypothetical protein